MKLLTEKVTRSIEKSVLCWLATLDNDGFPNVSPKEIFTQTADDKIAIALIASPGSLRNIKMQPKVCVSFIDIFVQKGYKVKGTAKVLEAHQDNNPDLQRLKNMAGPDFPFSKYVVITPIEVSEIVAPSYLFKSDTEEKGQIKSALKTYEIYNLLEIDQS